MILFPAIFVWFTFRRGYPAKTRILAMVWLVVAFLLTVVLTIVERVLERTNSYTPYAAASMEVRRGSGECTDDAPLAVTIRNDSNISLNRYTWRISVKAKGHSTELNSSGEFRESDLILAPRATATFCEPIPMLWDNQYSMEELEFLPGSVSVSDPMM